MGTGSLFAAYKSLPTSERGMVNISLAETNSRDTQIENGRGCCCDFVVHNTTDREIYCYSRFAGSGSTCKLAR
jgi:hypothetical protein